MKTPRPLFQAALLAPALLILSGCATETVLVDPNGTSALRSQNQINVQDWQDAANDLVSKLLSSGVLERAAKQPAVMQVSRIVNNTQQQVDTDSLIKKIRIQLNSSGKVVTKAEDLLADRLRESQEFETGKKSSDPIVDYTLTGKLLEDRVRVGEKRQTTFTFQLSLVTVKDGLAVWEGEKLVGKGDKTAGAFGGTLGL